MSNGAESGAVPPAWECVSCHMTLPKAPALPFCPFCTVLQPNQTMLEPQPQGYQNIPFGNQRLLAGQFTYPEQPLICPFCEAQVLQNRHGHLRCISCGTVWSSNVADVVQGGVGPGHLNSGLTGDIEDEVCDPNSEEMAKRELTRRKQSIDSQIHNIVKCKCGAVFNPGARVCPNDRCGLPAPRKEPQGPPCDHCGELLITADALKCEACKQKQTKKKTMATSPETASPATSLPPGFSSQSLSHPPQAVVSAPSHSTHSNPFVFGNFAQNLNYVQRFPMVYLTNNNRPSLLNNNQIPPQLRAPTSLAAQRASVPGVPATARLSKEMLSEKNRNDGNSNANSSPLQERVTTVHGSIPDNPKSQPSHQHDSVEVKPSISTTSSASVLITTTTAMTSTSTASTTCTTTTSSSTVVSYAGAVKGQGQKELSGMVAGPTSPVPNLDGLKPSDSTKTLKLTFHAIIPLPYWDFDQNSKIHVRFGHPRLGHWKLDSGDFHMRKIDDLYSEIWCTFDTFDAKLLDYNAGIPYKYVVTSPKLADKDDCYEFLHVHSNEGNVNRCIMLSQKCPDVYHKYDTIVYPKKTKVSKSWYGKISSKISDFIHWKKSHDDDGEFTPLNGFNMSTICLNIYLGEYKSMICEGRFQQGLNIIGATCDIQHIFESLCTYHIQCGVSKMVQLSKMNDFREEIKTWLTSVLTHIEENPFNIPGKQLTAAFFILSCLGRCYPKHQQLSNKFIISLIRMLTFTCDTLHMSQCADYEFLQTCLQHSSQKDIMVAVKYLPSLFKRVAGKNKPGSSLEWLTALPLYHFLTKQSKPFDKLSVKTTFDLKKHKEIGLEEVKHQTTPGFVAQSLSVVKPYFTLDPLLCHLFIYLTPDSDFPILCKHFEPSITVDLLKQNAVNTIEISKIEEKMWAVNIQSVIESLVSEEDSSVLSSVIESSILIFQRFSKLKSSSEHIVSLLSNSSLLVMHVVAQLDTVTYQNSKWQSLVQEALHRWISDTKVIGGTMFGGSVPTNYGNTTSQWREKSRLELQIWNRLLSIDTPTPQVCNDWNAIIKKLVSKRITSESPELKIDIVCMMEDVGNIRPALADTVMEAGYEAIDILVKKPQYHGLESLAEHKSKSVGKLLGRILEKKYPNASDIERVSFDDLLEWHMWPIFITIFVSKPILREGIPEEYHCAGLCAQTCIQHMYQKLKKGEITVEELQMVNKSQEQMKRLCLAASDGDGSSLHKSVKEAIQMRLEEYEAYLSRHKALSHLCNCIHSVDQKVQGLVQLDAELATDYTNEAIYTLCVRNESGGIQLVCFLTAKSLLKFASDFQVVNGQTYSNEIFTEFWRRFMTKALTECPELSIDDVFTSVWQPCIEQCQCLLESLMSLSMKLTDVDTILGPHRVRMELQLHSLLKGVNVITNKTEDSSLLDKATRKIRIYWDLQKYQNAADIFLRLKNSLGLTTGDFQQVEQLSHQLQSSVKDQCVQDVDDSLVNTGKFLQDTAKDSRKIVCLEKFAKCQKIVKWLRKETKGVNDIQNFVNVALATAAGGEGDLSYDKLSHLRTVGSGYASLIYKLPDNADFTDLKKACTSLWEALEKNQSLPTLLEQCNKDTDWYQSLKETQGTVEVTSYGQMRNILRYGYFQVGISSQSKSVCSIHDLVSLKLFPGVKRLPKTTYNLDELRDLESKLVLITGSKAEYRMEVDHYLNIIQHVTRIAEALLALQQAGNVKYSWWNVAFHCATYLVIDNGEKEQIQLQEQNASQRVNKLCDFAKEMEDSLIEWKNEVKESRSRHYELTYYTTLQMLRLRKELGFIRDNPEKNVDPEILALLESISNHVNSQNVRRVMNDLKEHLHHPQLAIIPEGFLGEKSDTLETASLPIESDGRSTDANSQYDETENYTHGGIDKLSVSLTSSTSNQNEALNDNPRLTQQELNDDQNKIFADLVDYQGYSKLLVLKALEVFKDLEELKKTDKPSGLYDIFDWCAAHVGKFKFKEAKSIEDPDSTDDESSTVSSSDKSSEVSITHSYRPSSLAVASVHTSVQHQTTTTNIKVVHKNVINELHPVVQEIVEDFEYDLEDTIEAVQLLGTRDRAVDYLASRDSKNESEEANIPVPVPEPTFEERENIIVCNNPEAEENYLGLDELGVILGKLNQQLPAKVSKKRTFNDELKPGCPNLIITPFCDILKTVLALYMEDDNLPLPTLEEVLMCSFSTTEEEVNLLWQRAIGDPDHKRIFCLVHAENLSYQIRDKVVESLRKFSQGKQDYRLVILCGKENEKSHIVSKLQLHKKAIVLKHEDEIYQKYLRDHFTTSLPQGNVRRASVVDLQNSCVRIVSSNRSGMGKSLFIQRMEEKLRSVVTDHEVKSTHQQNIIPIHGPVVTPDVVLNFLKNHYHDDPCMIYHFDIAPDILSEVDTILFSLLILSGLTDSQSRVWRCHPSHLYAIEVTLIRNDVGARTVDLLNLLPTVKCLTPNQALELENATSNPFLIGMNNKEFRGATFQRVYQYLRRHSKGQKLDKFEYNNAVEGTTDDCLKHFLSKCGVQDPSWTEIHHFTKFLDIQLESCEKSVFCKEDVVGDVMSGLKGFVVKFMIKMSRDFATPSLQCEVNRVNLKDQPLQSSGNINQYTIEERRKWEESSHPYIFFNNDGESITFVGFIINSKGDLIDRKKTLLEAGIMKKQLYAGLERQGVNFSDNDSKWNRAAMIEKLSMVMGLDQPHDPDKTYVLTVDNVMKILAIQMRFRCGIPVVIMGETGCGKTRLIRYMCDLAKKRQRGRNMHILKVHGGINEEDVINFMEVAEEEAENNRKQGMDTVVFFDEANTTDAIGLIKEIMCDRRIHGRPIKKDLKFIAACNPYRRHSEKMITRLREAGLGYFVKASKTKQRFGDIPLRELVYRVLDLPPSMRALVYDFGQLKKGTEDKYITHIVKDHVRKHPILSQQDSKIVSVITQVLTTSQAYMRERTDECSFVSLRDVERAMIVFEYFCEMIPNFRQAENTPTPLEATMEEATVEEHPSVITSALILSLSVCYHSRLQHREEYEKIVSSAFASPMALPGKSTQFRNEIIWCQNVLLDNMELGPNIAKNAALRENVFMMAICIELRIPLFLVGKPGSSKSLAKSIIQDSMHGKTSRTQLLQTFKQVHMFSYQCSKLATSESVIDIFNSAMKFQSNQDTTQYVSVVVLDEVGLAEDSPNLPLKALHPLLEDGTKGAGAEGKDEIITREQRVAFIGISNWALDPAKMNRGVMVTRGIPDIKELEFSARGICGKEANDQIKKKLDPYFTPLAEAYKAICCGQKLEFFGLRDFYSLIKMLYWMCKESRGLPLTWPQMKHAIMRNFGGLKSDTLNPFEEFRKRLKMQEEKLNPNDFPDAEMVWPIINPDCSRLGLIKTSLNTKDVTFHGENRYLLFLTENYAALDILKHYIRGKKQSMGDLSGDAEVSKPYTLFGSSFPKDKEYTQVCRNINQIKICMETGRTVILLNLENLYESLYDVLNQYYLHYGDIRYVDLGLQTHRVKCRVHSDFKLIMIAERERVYEKFPTALINRLEKHFVLTSSILKDWQTEVLWYFQQWIERFSKIMDQTGKKFKEGHAFIGYQEDTPAAVVFQASQQLKRFCKGVYWKRDLLHDSGVLGDISSGELTLDHKGTDVWKGAVLKLSQYLLLHTASDASLVRLKKTALADQQEELIHLYYSQQHHKSIADFVLYHIQNSGMSEEGLLLQVTTHGHLLLQEELDCILDMNVEAFLLQEFDTELDFCNKIGPIFQRDTCDSCLLVIQCDSGHMNSELIACARYRIYDEQINARNKTQRRDGVTHVLFIINLPHHVYDTAFVGFQGDPWISAHIDDLRPTTGDTIESQHAFSSTISELFIGDFIHDIRPLLGLSETEDINSSVETEESVTEEDIIPMVNSRSPTMSPTLTVTDIEDSSSDKAVCLDSGTIPIENELNATENTQLSQKDGLTDTTFLLELGHESDLPKVPEREELVLDVLQNQSENTSDTELSTSVAKPEEDIKVIDIEDGNEVEIRSSDSPENDDSLQSSSVSVHLQDMFAELDSADEDGQDHDSLGKTVSSLEEYAEQQEPTPVNERDRMNTEELSVEQVGTEIKEVAQFGDSMKSYPDYEEKLPKQHKVAQCIRLYDCIQAAAAKVEYSTKDRSTQRVKRLTKLIKRFPECLDPYSFHAILVMHIYQLLQKREYDRPDLSDWVLSEALNAKNLEFGGTFRNALARKIDEVVTKIFAKIIANIDCNYNLDLLNAKAGDSPLTRFWLAMFMDPKIQQLSYSDNMQGDKISGFGGKKLDQDFKCKLPFFWLVKDVVKSQFDNARSCAGVNKLIHHQQLCEFIRGTPVGAVLESVDTENIEEFYKFYLHDYIRSEYRCKHRSVEHNDMELRLVSNALDNLVHCSKFHHNSLTSMIAALHVAYGANTSQLLWFGQLVSHSPSIMYNDLVGMFPSGEVSEMGLHLFAAEKMIEKLEPPLHKDDPNPNLAQWLNLIRLSQNTIDSILSLKSHSERVLKARHSWHRLRATQLFVEHVMLKHSEIDLKLLARRLCARWKGSCDFTKVNTINAVQLQLNGVKKLLKKDKLASKEVRKSCRGFFMEMVSELCFKGDEVPEPDLVKMLLDTVFIEKEDEPSTQDLTPYKDGKADEIPTIRSFLLQLLLEHSLPLVRDHLKDYFDRSYHVIERSEFGTADHDLCLLIIQCFEDSLNKKLSCQHITTEEEVKDVTKCLIEGYNALQEYGRGTPRLEYLEGVAKVRYSLSVVAKVLKIEDRGHHIMELLRAAGRMCSDREINCIDPTGCKDTVGPVIYLLKLLVRQYGMPCLKAAAEVHEWIIPAELRSTEDKEVDLFVIYEDLYKTIRKAISGAIYGNELEMLVETTQNLNHCEVVYFVLALFNKATLSRSANTDSARRINDDALKRLNEFIMRYQLLSNELRLTSRALLANQQGGRVLAQMIVSPEQPLHCRTLMGVVVHAATVFFARQNVDVLSPFVNMLNNPAILNQSYIPTIPEDPLIESQGAMLQMDTTGKFYECPNGHKYFVGNCGRTYYTGVCNVCKTPIGGTSGKPVSGNKVTNTQDSTKKGYDLGAPETRTISAPERNLSARAVCIVRALMHSVFVWASCNNDSALEAIASLVRLTPRIPPQHLPEFFWAHLEKDIELLGRDTGRGLDEAVMIVHLILQRILIIDPPISGNIQTVSSLRDKEARNEWERIFNEHYIHPVLSTLDKSLKIAMDHVAGDEQDHDQLFYLVYEKVKYTEQTLDPHLWTYRSRITLEHLKQTLQEKEMREKYPILYEFLHAETELRATQYLPHITRLQQCLYDRYNRQIDKADVKNQAIEAFIKELPNEAIKNEYREMIDSVKAAWSLVGHKLKNHGRLPVEEKDYVARIDDNTPMEYLIPTTSEAGVCTTALVDFLTLTHNNFIERCRGLVAKKDLSTINFWREHKVPINHLHRCHLLDYENQLPSIILSHCHYSLKVGKGQGVKYDHQALEKHILNRFIHGKPLIVRETIPQVVYRKDIYTTDTFAEIREKVEPQEELQHRVKQDIIAELRTPDRLRDALDVVEIVLGFLSSGGGKAADKSLGEYINKTLKMKRRHFSQKAKDSCQLKHALSLWETIAVELAWQLCLRGQEPFESIRQEYLCELSKKDDVDAINRCLSHFVPEVLLGTLYEFIRTYITHCKPHECDQPLVAVLEVVLERCSIELPHLSKFPASIKLDQAVATWKHIVHYYDKKN